ncbi:MAG: hypothetical protein M3N98_08330 [Actinomycetota bacterium]|nr:hypothetical protein [Actinomycetota bacterium]
MTFVISQEGDTGVAQQLVEWVTTSTWTDSRAFLVEHADALLTPSAEAALQQLIDDNPDHQVLVLHQWILQGARSDGIDAAYVALDMSIRFRALAEGLVAWVTTQSWDDARAFFDQHAHDLLTDEAEAVLAQLAVDNPGQPDLLAHQGLLALCRVDGADKAYLLLQDPDRLRGLVMSPAGQKDPARALPRARMLAGLFPEDPEAVLGLALAAMREGDRDTMERAIGVCHAIATAQQRRAFAQRLSELAEAEPDLAPVLFMLQGILDQPIEDPPA